MTYSQYAKLLGIVELAYRIGLSDGMNKKSTGLASPAKTALDQILYEEGMHPDLDPVTLYKRRPYTFIFDSCCKNILNDIHRAEFEEDGQKKELGSYDGITWFKIEYKNDSIKARSEPDSASSDGDDSILHRDHDRGSEVNRGKRKG